MTFQRESVQQIFNDCLPMLIKHWAEVTPFKSYDLEPDFGSYLAMEEAGMLRLFTARKDGQLLGYCIFVLRNNRHYKSKLFAYQDALYVSPQHRGFGHRFMAWCDDELKADGVSVVFQYVTERFNFSPILERHKYRQIEQVWAKEL